MTTKRERNVPQVIPRGGGVLWASCIRQVVREIENWLYQLHGESGGMDIPMNQPTVGSQNKRWDDCGGKQAADFPAAIVVDKPLNSNAK